MQKLLNKKLMGKKGFTLAELLVVIAILAILIAIAVPVFTHMVAEANLRVNQANVHSVRSAAIAHILTHLGDPDDTAGGTGPKLNSKIGDYTSGWVAVAQVDNNGNISELKVYVAENVRDDDGVFLIKEGISTAAPTNYFSGANATVANGWFEISDDVSEPFATVKPSMNSEGGNMYYVQAVITDLKEMD